MLRRNTRLRKEYLYRKSLETKEAYVCGYCTLVRHLCAHQLLRLTRIPDPVHTPLTHREVYEKKRRVREALQEGKPIPTELRKEGSELKHELELDDAEKQCTYLLRGRGCVAACVAARALRSFV